jgi:hypothetical protein
MVGGTLDWKDELGRWLKPFLDRLGHKGAATNVSALRVGIRVFSRWRSGLRSAHAINCTTSLRPGSGMRCRWKQNCLSRQTGSSAAAMPRW